MSEKSKKLDITADCYKCDERYSTRVAYFSMEFAVDQALKTYSGGLGYLSGSHMRSAYDLRQNVIGVGILWSYGYYDQTRKEDESMSVIYRRKKYYFLDDLGVTVSVTINHKPVAIKGYLLHPDTFGTAPIILLTTDIEENDFISRTITHKLYDSNEETRIAQEIVLGLGGFKMLEQLKKKVDIYHMNEGHALPLTFGLYEKLKDIDELKRRIVFTTHTPEAAGNEEHDINLLHRMGFFGSLDLPTVREITKVENNTFSLTLAALRVSKIANGVSKIHETIANKMWSDKKEICKIIGITNAQNRRYWADYRLLQALDEHEDYELLARNKHLKKLLFKVVADQTGKVLDPEVLTIVWARRFAEYKRPGLIKHDFERFLKLVERDDRPIQVIWAGKPYPGDWNSINIFNELVDLDKSIKRIAVLVRYELSLSALLKKGADLWLNTPRITREASGTSGMSACMNGAVHLSMADGWHPEFAKDGINSFTIPPCDPALPIEIQDNLDNKNLMDLLEETIIPLYYDRPKEWIEVIKNSMRDIIPAFDSGRMAHEYFEKMYNYAPSEPLPLPKINKASK